MTAPFDQPATVQLAQAAPRGTAAPAAGEPTRTAQLPAGCDRDSIDVTIDVPTRYHLPQIPNLAAFQKQTAGDSIVVSTQGHGQLVMDRFVAAARSPHPPVVVLGDGTVLTAAQVLARPEQVVAPDLCAPQLAQAGGLADGQPADPTRQAGAVPPDQNPDTVLQQLADVAPAAGPAAGPDGGESGGGRFSSTFAPSGFDGLGYGAVDPLAFSRTPPVLQPGSGSPDEEAPPAPPPSANDGTLVLGDVAAKEDLGGAGDQVAAVPAPQIGAVPVSIAITTTDPAEAVTGIVISGLPAGVIFNHGHAGPNGTWLLSPGELAGLALSGVPADGDQDFILTVRVDMTQGGEALPPLTGTIAVTLDAVADIPTLNLVGAAAGAEDTAIALPDIAAALQDSDGSETLTLSISGVPDGATLSAGTNQGGGVWSLAGVTPAGLDALTITPPAGFSGSFDLTVTATATEGATVGGGGELQEADNTASTAQSFTVTVDPARDSTLSVADGAVKEDLGQAGDQVAAVPQPGTGPQPLAITLALGANEMVDSITISGVPAGVTLSHGTDNGDGTWSLLPADLAGLTLAGSPADSDAEFDLGVTVGLSQNGTALPDLTGSVHVVIDAVADVPTLTLTGAASGTEDAAIALPDIAAALQDGDGSETLTLAISGVPDGAMLSAGTNQGGGVWSLTGLTPADLDALTITPPADFSGSFDLTVTATATESATVAGGGELQEADNTVSTGLSFTVTVGPQRDSTLSVVDTAVKEDLGEAADQTAAVPQPTAGAQPLTINLTAGANETVTSITLSNVPTGVTFNHGTDNGDGTWSLSQADLAGLTISGVTADSDADFDLGVTVGLSQSGTALADLTGSIHVTVDAVADLPALTLAGAASGAEDTAIGLPDIAAALQDATSETLTLTISGVPAGSTLSAGIDQSGGVWSLTGLTQGQLDALTITPPADFSGSFDLTVTATATEAATVAPGVELQSADNTAGTSQTFTVTVGPQGDSALSVADAAVKEDLGQAADQIAAVPQPGTGPQPLTISLTLGASETVTSVTLSSVPSGVTFNHGTDNGDGTWSLSQADLTGLTIDGVTADSDADFDLGVTVGLSQNGIALPDLTGSIHVTVDAVADLPALTLAGTASGAEDTAIALPDIAAALQDATSETLTLTISGVPTGATLSAGTDQGGGVWNLTGLTQPQLDALTVTPPADFSGSFDLTVTATATESAAVAPGTELQTADNTASTSQSFSVTVAPARDSTLSLADTAVKEDLGQAGDQTAAVPQPSTGPQPLTIALTLGAGESVTSITLSNVPAGVAFNHGTDSGNGTWSLTQTDLSGLTIDGVSADSDTDFDLGVTVGLSQNGTALPDLTGSIHVTVDAVADLPALTLTGTASGTEGAAIALPDIAAALQDATSETLTLTISGVPTGATLSAGTDQGGGVWSVTGLTQPQLDALTITPPANFSGSFDLTVTATATEGAAVTPGVELQSADNTASTSQSFSVTVTPVRDSTLSVADTAVKEDLGQAADQIASVPQPPSGAQPLTINLTVGANETVTGITLSSVPSGVTFNHGTDNGDGTWSMTQADLAGLTIDGVAADSDTDFDLGVTVGLSQNGTALPDLTGSIHVTVDAVADLPTLVLAGTASGAEDTAIALSDIAAALQDATSETLTLTISGVPTGATLSAGTDQGGGAWSLTGLTQPQLDALTITPPANFSGSFNLTVTATATEAAAVAPGVELQSADNTASTSQSFTVTVAPQGDSTMSAADTAVKEDLGQAGDQAAAVPQPGTGPQPLSITLTVGANESVTSITLSNVPIGVTFSHGTNNGNGTWSLTQADLAGLTINGITTDSDADFDLGVTVGLSQNGTPLPNLTGSVHVTVDAVADLPTLTLTGTASGAEDTAIALPDIAAALQDATSETLTLTISGVPAGATLSAGTNEGGGVWSLSGLTQPQLDALTIAPPANFSGSFNLTVTATATESAAVVPGIELQSADNTASTSQSFSVTVTPVRDSTLGVADAAVKEDLGQAPDQTTAVPQPTTGAQPLTISVAVGANETVTGITLSNVPNSVTFNQGINNGDGTWTLTEADLAGLTINGVSADSDTDFNLGVTVGLSQNGTALPSLGGTIHVTVDAVADLPTLVLTGTASGTEDTAIALPDIAAALQDASSETLSLTISGVPAGATLSAGTNQGGGVWSLTGLTQPQLDALTITPPADFSGSFDLTVTATATESAAAAPGVELQSADNTASTSQSFSLTVTPVRDSTLSVADAAVKEDLGEAGDQIAAVPAPGTGPQPLVINLTVGTNETVTGVTLSSVPNGVTFNHGTDNGDGTWSLTQADLAGLTINGVSVDSDADFNLGVTVGLSQNGIALPDLAGSIHVTVDAVADLPTLTLTGTAAGAEDTAIALLDIVAGLQDATGETLSLTISGVPSGATLSVGTNQGGGVWSLTGLTQPQLDTLTITPPANFSGSFNLTVTATATEGAAVAPGVELQSADNTASTSQSFSVTVGPQGDSTLSVADTAVKEDLGQAADQTAAVPQPGTGPQPLTITLTVGANETVTGITLSSVPAGVTFNHGANNGDGTWSLTQADLAGLTINGVTADSDADFNLGVTVGLSQNGTALPSLNGSIQVTVDAVADLPTLTLTGTASGTEDTAIALPDIAAALQDATSETLTLTVSGVPAGATLSAGTNQGGGVWSLTGLTQPQLDALTITPPVDFSGSFNLTVTATATESAAAAPDVELQSADNTASTSQSFAVTVTPVRDSTLSVADAAVKEDLGQAADQTASVPQPTTGAQPLTITLMVGANETVTGITLSSVPAGVTFNHGTNNGDGTWSLTQADLAGLTINGVSADSDADFNLGVTVGLSQNGTALPSLGGSIHVTVDAVADLPTLTLTGTASGAEDTAIALPDIAAALQDATSETLSLTISGVPSGATLSAGTDQGGGVWSLTGLTQPQIDGLTITPPANFSGSFSLTVTASATESAAVAPGIELQGADNTASTSQSFFVTVTPVRDSTLSVADTAVKEDLGQAADQIAAVPQPTTGAQPLTITLTVGASETVTGITLSSVPNGVTFNHGTDNGDGTWSLTQADLAGLTINGVSADSDADFNLGVTVGLSQNGTALPSLGGSIHVTVDAVADLPTLTLTGTASGAEDTAIALPDIAAALQDTTSETLSLTISGVPSGATLSAGTNQGGGVWSLTGLTQPQLSALTVTPPANFSGSFNLTVTATATESAAVAPGVELQSADNTASTSQSFSVTVTPVRDSTLSVADAAVKEDLGQAADQTASVPQPTAGAQPLTITLTVGANETVTGITLSSVPAGVTFNHGTNNGNGTWSLTQADLAGLTINGVTADSDADFNLGVTVGLSQNGTALPSLSGSIHVTVDAVADLPTLTLTGTASGNQNTAIALPDIAAALQDATGETLSLTISGVPSGATLSAGTNQGGGVWSLTGLTQPQLNALTVTPAASFSGNFNLTVTATATEGAAVAAGVELQSADNTATTSQTFQVHVNAVPSGAAASATVNENGNEAVGSFNAGTQAATNNEIASGTLGYSFGGDGAAASGAFTWSGTVSASDPDGGGSFSSLTSGGQSVVWTVSADGLTLTGKTAASNETVATLTVTNVATGAYTYEQKGPFDHPDIGQSSSADPIDLAFGYTVKDGSGDTATGSLSVGVRDDAPIAGVVNKTAAEGVGANTNLMIVLDLSGSMNDASGLTNLSRLEVAKAAIAELIEQYDMLGDVKVNLVTFSTNASEATGAWVTPAQAITVLNALIADGSTNYDAALAAAQATFGDAGKIAGAQNVAYFLSDGKPNEPSGSAGISAAEQASWETFLNSNDIKAFALGMGTGLDASNLSPIAYDGIAGQQLDPLLVTDMGQLAETLTDTIAAPQVPGGVLVDSVPVSHLGADNGYVKTLTIDSTIYTYNPSGNGSIAVNGTDHGTFDTSTNTLTVSTVNGATFAIDMDSGAYVYTLPASVSANVSETFDYSLADNDGDTAASTLTFNVTNTDQAPLVRSDSVITSINGSGAAIPIPGWALVANDVDPDGQAISVTGVSNAVEGSVASAAGTVTFTDNDQDGGSFTYTGTANGLTDTGLVMVDRDQRNESTLDGTGLGEILIGRTGNDTINGYEGNDILIGNGGTDSLLGGAGDDILAFHNLASTYNGGTGLDTLRVADSATGTLDFRAAATTDSRIENIDQLALDGGNNVTLQLDYQGVLDFEPGSNTLRITGGAGDTVDLQEAIGASGTDKWIMTASTATVDTYQFTSSNAANPVATLIVDHHMTVQ